MYAILTKNEDRERLEPFSPKKVIPLFGVTTPSSSNSFIFKEYHCVGVRKINLEALKW